VEESEAVMLTADIVVLAPVDGELCVLVVKRANEPFKGSWALPGGKVDRGETSREAAHRELKEETGVTVPNLNPVGVYDRPDRDPRGRFVSVAFSAVLMSAPEAIAGDDAVEVSWQPIRKLADHASDGLELAFDHDVVVDDALYRASMGAAQAAPYA
jgi:8-oxo-dGTP diphosphatase